MAAIYVLFGRLGIQVPSSQTKTSLCWVETSLRNVTGFFPTSKHRSPMNITVKYWKIIKNNVNRLFLLDTFYDDWCLFFFLWGCVIWSHSYNKKCQNRTTINSCGFMAQCSIYTLYYLWSEPSCSEIKM